MFGRLCFPGDSIIYQFGELMLMTYMTYMIYRIFQFSADVDQVQDFAGRMNWDGLNESGIR